MEDLSFKAGDRISLLKRINNEWLRGSLQGREGIFPTAFVNIVCDVNDGMHRLHMSIASFISGTFGFILSSLFCIVNKF